MKKRNILTIALALVLVAAIAVGGTLAYLTAQDAPVTNTFTFAQGMTVTLSEPQPEVVADESITGNATKGYDYTNVVPGQELNKAPEVSTTTSVDAYVFVKVDGANAKLKVKAITDGWTAVGTPDNYGNGVYYQTVTGASDSQDLGTIFERVVVGSNLEATDTLPNITIKVFEIQQNGITLAQATAEANTYFNTPAPNPAA